MESEPGAASAVRNAVLEKPPSGSARVEPAPARGSRGCPPPPRGNHPGAPGPVRRGGSRPSARPRATAPSRAGATTRLHARIVRVPSSASSSTRPRDVVRRRSITSRSRSTRSRAKLARVVASNAANPPEDDCMPQVHAIAASGVCVRGRSRVRARRARSHVGCRRCGISVGCRTRTPPARREIRTAHGPVAGTAPPAQASTPQPHIAGFRPRLPRRAARSCERGFQR